MSIELKLPATEDKRAIFTAIEGYLGTLSLRASTIDDERPWGGFFVIDESQTDAFITQYFTELPRAEIEKGGKLSPKILVVEPRKRLSWQYHHRRAELWRVVSGPVGVVTSETDEYGPVREISDDDTVQFGSNVRHRLVGLDDWGVVAEIWQHTDPKNPSDEDDIVRIEDDFKR